MGEDVTITFTATDEVSSVIQEIIDALDGMGDPDAADTDIEISSDQMEPEIEQVMWDMLDLIKERAVDDDAEFLLNLNE